MLASLAHLNHWQIDLIIAGLLLQGGFVTVFPEEVIMITLGVLRAQGKVTWIEAILAVQLGLLPANVVLVLAGKYFGLGLLDRRPFRWFLKREAIAAALHRSKKWGGWVVFLARFTPVIRAPIYFSAGLAKCRIRDFMRNDFLASCIQVPVLLLVGRAIGSNTDSILEAYQRVGNFIAILLAVVALLTAVKLTVGSAAKSQIAERR